MVAVEDRAGPNLDPREIDKFGGLADAWWDPAGPARTLHDINPLRLAFIQAHAGLAGSAVLDVGCGGGVLSEAMARAGARVTGIDAGEAMIRIANLHRRVSGLEIDYRVSTAERFADDHRHAFDCVACMELLEHVPDPDALLGACAAMLAPGGRLFVSTINRTPRAYLLAVLGAEYLLGLLPRGTHDYARFIRPHELDAMCRGHGLRLSALRGMAYNPLSRRASLCDSVAVNYLAVAEVDA